METKFKIGQTVIITTPGAGYSSTPFDKVDMCNLLLMYPNQRPSNDGMRVEYINWPTESDIGKIVAIDAKLRMDNQCYVVEVNGNAFVMGERGLDAVSTKREQNTFSKLETLDIILLDAKGLVNVGSQREDEWNRDKNIVDTLRATLFEKMSPNEVQDCNRIYKAWKDWANPKLGISTNELTYNFNNKHFCFTGFRDALLVNKLTKQYSSIVHTSIKGGTKLDYLICNDTSRQTVKMKKATDKGATILTYAEFKKLI